MQEPENSAGGAERAALPSAARGAGAAEGARAGSVQRAQSRPAGRFVPPEGRAATRPCGSSIPMTYSWTAMTTTRTTMMRSTPTRSRRRADSSFATSAAWWGFPLFVIVLAIVAGWALSRAADSGAPGAGQSGVAAVRLREAGLRRLSERAVRRGRGLL